MCGIAGLINIGSENMLRRMIDVQKHRGPDDRGCWTTSSAFDEFVGLGSCRLSIQDLSPAGHMPMSTRNGNITLTYNGEIYNYPQLKAELEKKGYAFRSNADTEAILYMYQEYGEQCLNRLNGMFALALWDARQERLLLARDPFGIKPLYYFQQGKRLAFASENKSLLLLKEINREIDPFALHRYLTFNWVPEPQTIFSDIHKIPPGYYAIYQKGEFHVHQYWDLPLPPKEHEFQMNETELVEELRSRFIQTVQAQLIGDVPLGAFLSAGLDSNGIVAAMKSIGVKEINTFTVSFPEKYRRGKITADDPDVALKASQFYGAQHTDICIEPDVVKLLPKLIWHMDEPVCDPAILSAYLVCKEARQKVTILLSGIGGDEVFAGYRKYQAHLYSQWYQHLPYGLRRRLIEPFIRSLPSFRGTPIMTYVRLAKKMARSGSLSPKERFITDCFYYDDAFKKRLYNEEWGETVGGYDSAFQHRDYFHKVSHADFLNQMLYLDLKAFMVSLNLNYNDKMSMANSLEVRVPFLDVAFVEWCFQHIPPTLKLHGNTTKYIFRQAMGPLMPDEVLRQRKAGFGAPADYWLVHDLREMTQDLLSEKRIRERGFFNPYTVQQLLREHYSGRNDWSWHIWQLLTFELWMQNYL